MIVYCNATGYPSPHTCYVIVPGMDMQVSIPLNGSPKVWTKYNVTLNNSGTYTCIVQDESGYATKDTSVMIYGKLCVLCM